MPINRTSKTKSAISKAAMELFAAHGYKGTSVRNIASKVGIKQSALYNHFKNKEDIFLTICADIFSTPFSSKNNLEDAKSGKKFFANYVVQYKLISFDATKEKLFRIMMIELLQDKSLRESFMSEYHNKNIALLSEALFIMMQAGLIRSSDPMLMANEFLAPLFYYRLQVTLLRIDSLSTTSLSTIFEKHVDFFWDSISK
ncbi:MAG: TetR/AcrR family transcriptional regulator [Campylobacterota bacterium]|nr:TetR/AcrR family transcriptional regulator [Campylobacterota bacterium]